jgi:ATP-dependent Clp protease adaptor protein ClpS
MPKHSERTEFFEDAETELAEPPMYRVVLLNDDYTPMDFVVMILMTVFRKDRQAAENIMMNVHRQGRGECGVYTYEVAETKVQTVKTLAQAEKHPLRCVMEEA